MTRRAPVLFAASSVLCAASAWSPLPWSAVLLAAGLVALVAGGWLLYRARRAGGAHRGTFPYGPRRGGRR
ncbi:hypothetical protein [Pseudonocardia parietis]|uniref:MYXO-CTERM domain-containing protein n=1 Tax=Pseudonocardia parietis TaxID=570936 RepID=A0ABS4W3A4_9PSEU|nr:hypothetical protein [Pseudonocardia parietis]MBP2370677.1 hypothetical protein [Pseudonocardia parietis]